MSTRSHPPDETRESRGGDGIGGSRSAGFDDDTIDALSKVFVLDGPTRSDLFDMWLSDSYSVVTASSRSEATEQFDESVAVALVRNEISDELKSHVERLIKTRSPFCRTVITTTERVEIMFPGISYDVCLTEPTTRDGVRETVDRLVRRAEYQAALKQYYSCAMSATNMEVRMSEASLESKDEYEAVTKLANRLRDRLNRILASFDKDDLDAIRRSIKPTVEFGSRSKTQNKRRGDKHRPDKCVGCGLEWGVYHGPQLGKGFDRLGAFVWECTDCRTVQNLPDPSHRRLAKR